MMISFYTMLRLLSKKELVFKKFMIYLQLTLGLLKKLKNIVDTEEKLKQNELDKTLLHTAKKMGFF